jgi:hypothetical protein
MSESHDIHSAMKPPTPNTMNRMAIQILPQAFLEFEVYRSFGKTNENRFGEHHVDAFVAVD